MATLDGVSLGKRLLAYALLAALAVWIGGDLGFAAADCGPGPGECTLQGVGWVIGVGVGLLIVALIALVSELLLRRRRTRAVDAIGA